jgi:hypothetical protein
MNWKRCEKTLLCLFEVISLSFPRKMVKTHKVLRIANLRAETFQIRNLSAKYSTIRWSCIWYTKKDYSLDCSLFLLISSDEKKKYIYIYKMYTSFTA